MRSFGTCPKCKTGLLRPSGAGGCNCTCELCGYTTRPEYLQRPSGSSSRTTSSCSSSRHTSGDSSRSGTQHYSSGGKQSAGCGTWILAIIILWFLWHFL